MVELRQNILFMIDQGTILIEYKIIDPNKGNSKTSISKLW